MPYLFQPTKSILTNSVSVTCNTSNSTASFVLFTITGTIKVKEIYGVVTTVLSAAHTAAHLRLNDQTATPAITLATGVDLSAAPVGSITRRVGLAAVALTSGKNSVGLVQDANSAGNAVSTELEVTKKTGAVTTIDYRYTTTDAPSSGVIEFFLVWEPVSADAAVA